VGHGKLRRAVLDSGPLIHLAEIGCLGLLTIFEGLCIPHAVWFETVGQSRVPQEDLAVEFNIQRCALLRSEVADFIRKNNLTDLHLGEQECLLLCLNQEIYTILTDDLAVRDAARRFNIVPVGSLGIIVAAYEHEVITRDDAEVYMAKLYDVSSLFVTRDLVDLAIAKLRPHPEQ
jgi:predicted nucleic acid-binding protein